MKTFTVTWTITIEADTPRKAAELAQKAQTAPDTLATCFQVIESFGTMFAKVYDIDLLEENLKDGQ